jgi:hypothetical protein
MSEPTSWSTNHLRFWQRSGVGCWRWPWAVGRWRRGWRFPPCSVVLDRHRHDSAADDPGARSPGRLVRGVDSPSRAATVLLFGALALLPWLAVRAAPGLVALNLAGALGLVSVATYRYRRDTPALSLTDHLRVVAWLRSPSSSNRCAPGDDLDGVAGSLRPRSRPSPCSGIGDRGDPTGGLWRSPRLGRRGVLEPARELVRFDPAACSRAWVPLCSWPGS